MREKLSDNILTKICIDMRKSSQAIKKYSIKSKIPESTLRAIIRDFKATDKAPRDDKETVDLFVKLIDERGYKFSTVAKETGFNIYYVEQVYKNHKNKPLKCKDESKNIIPKARVLVPYLDNDFKTIYQITGARL